MRISKTLERQLGSDPIVAVINAPPSDQANNAYMNIIRSNHAEFSQAAQHIKRRSGVTGKGILSVHFGAGKEPGTHDATFVPLSEVRDGSEIGERFAAAVEACRKREFLLTLIGVSGMGCYRVAHR